MNQKEREAIKNNLALIHPCVEDSTKCIGEGSLVGKTYNQVFIDSKILCKLLENNSVLKEVKCSEKLGLAKFKMNGKTVTIFKTGRIIVRMADNENDVIETIAKVKEIVQESIIQS